MMKKNITAGAAALCILVLSAGGACAGSPIFRNNVLTASHAAVPGTHVSLVPPKGAESAPVLPGFDMPSRGIRIQVAETAAPYAESEGILTADGVRALGITYADKSPVTLNASPAALVSGSSAGSEEQGVYLLVLGNDRISVYIYGFYPAGDRSADALVKNSLLSCIFSAAPAQSGGYSVSTAGTSFAFSDEVSSTRYFTVGGSPRKDTVDQALFTVSVSNDGVMPEGRWDYSASAIDGFLSSYTYAVISSRQVTFGGLPGIETIAEFDGPVKTSRTAAGGSVRRPVRSKGYQALLFDDDEGKVYVFSGIAITNGDNFVSQFTRMASSFSRVN
ncbi:MAG: hypothetical protein LBR87_08855 [Synergistaceae bacterium]|jgi:hypothetical protein|nr:hypothetical protein [Synergistaceae bacterium]